MMIFVKLKEDGQQIKVLLSFGSWEQLIKK